MRRIHLVLGASKRLFCLFACLYGGASVILCAAGYWANWWWGWDILALSFCLYDFNHQLRYHVFRSAPRAIVQAICLDDSSQKRYFYAGKRLFFFPYFKQPPSRWLLIQRDGHRYPVILREDSVFTSGITLLNFKQEGHFLSKCVIMDQQGLMTDNYRQFRTWWRQYGNTETPV